MKTYNNSFVSNRRLARLTWGELPRSAIRMLKALTEEHGLLVSTGDLQLLDGRWYVTHAGLLRVARSKKCAGIRSALVTRLSDPSANRWIFTATVYKSLRSRGFVGYGDADPSNTSSLVRGAEMRVAETRAVNRALRKAYGIGLCSVEELGSFSPPQKRVRRCATFEWSSRIERLKQWPAQTAGQALPSDPKIRTRSQLSEALCSRFLWDARTARRRS